MDRPWQHSRESSQIMSETYDGSTTSPTSPGAEEPPLLEPEPGLNGIPVKWYDADRRELYTKITPFGQQIDPAVDFVFKPITLTALTLALVTLAYVAMSDDVLEEGRSKQRLGVYASVSAFLLFSMIQFRDGPFIRPHPAFWRVVLGINLLYELGMVFLLFQDVQTARGYMKMLDPSLGVALPEKSYAEQCDFTVENLWGAVDIFIVAHSIGWFGKAVILRDYWFCWILSVLFEFAEYCLEHQLPNFKECWWDHWLLDVLICNWIGIWVGMKTCEYFEVKHYTWRSLGQTKGFRKKTKRVFKQFSPYDFTAFKWGTTTNFRSYVAVVLLLALFLTAELTPFYIKYHLWMQPSHPFMVWRIIGILFCALPAVREFYQYVNEPGKNPRMGQHAWLMTASILTEALVCYKWSDFPPFPRNVKLFFSVLGLSLVAFPVVQFGVPAIRRFTKRKQETKGKKSEKS